MLVVTRKQSEVIKIGDNIRITICKVQGGKVLVGVDAPRDIKVVRVELEHKE